MSAALEIVQESGFATLSLPAVAARCDCGLNTVKRVYPRQEALCLAVVAYAAETGDAEVAKIGKRLFPNK